MQKSKWKQGLNAVYVISAVITIVLSLWSIIWHESFSAAASALMTGLKTHFSWLYLGVALFFVLFSLVLAFSPWGRVKLGRDDEKPEYSTISWFAMLFGTGMGIGLVFWAIAEPISHYVTPMAGIEPQTAEAADFAMRSCFMHWGLHPWGGYTVMGLGLAFFQFRKGENAMTSRLLRPLWGDRRFARRLGTGVDVFTVVLTTTGIATSLGMGCLQICEGMNYLFGIPSNMWVWLMVIIVIAIIYLKSAISGIGRGIKMLSDLNLVLFVGLMLLGIIVGPRSDMLVRGLRGARDYVLNFFQDSLRLSSNGDSTWINNWRVFYWAWWLSWAPFVGIFIARISRGRTVREFVLGVMLVPTLVSILWFTVFGTMALDSTGHFSTQELLAMAASPQTALFKIFNEYPLAKVLSGIAICLLVSFFVTSANSATFVLAMLSSDGELEPPNRKKVFWGVLIAIVAFALIMSGGIDVIQNISISIAFPYLFILLLICVSLVLALRKDKKETAPTPECGDENAEST